MRFAIVVEYPHKWDGPRVVTFDKDLAFRAITTREHAEAVAERYLVHGTGDDRTVVWIAELYAEGDVWNEG